jgi:CubicO group peptidase (beta-lactamase class C family)
MKWKASITQPTVSGLTTSTPKPAFRGFRRCARGLGAALALAASALPAAAAESHLPYLDGPRAIIQRGVQAVLLCNGVFTSERPLEAVFREELAYLKAPLGSPATVGEPGDASAEVVVDRANRSVRIGALGQQSVSARYQPGIGCVALPPDASPEEAAPLPALPEVPDATANDALPWPKGDLNAVAEPGPEVDQAALAAASAWAFDRPTAEQNTTALLILHRGKIIHERYAEGFDQDTRTRTWSTAKSLAVTLIGLLVAEGKLALDDPLPLSWGLGRALNPDADPRRAITLRHVLHMSSGLYPVDSWGGEYAIGSGLAYWAGASSQAGAQDRGLVRTPGTVWDYENYDTLLAVGALKAALGDRYLSYPREALLAPLGMNRTLLSTDRFGDFILSSQVYTSARDLARFGLLYAQNGVFAGQRLLDPSWIEFVRTPAPASAAIDHAYGGHFWLVPSTRTDVPATAFATAGNRGQYVIMLPEKDLVIVRRGLDWGKQGFDRWDLLREVLKAF